jgi:signal peptidase I
VALAVAMGVRTFFLQPFKIPTGSMQPTLWGVTDVNHINDPDFKVPPFLTRVKHWFEGKSYVHVVAKTDGRVEAVSRPWPPAIFSIYQRIKIGGQWHVIWFPPDYGAPPYGTLEYRAGLQQDRLYQKGDDVIKLEMNAGDHLFVNRTTYNFRKPHRGEIIVFETHGITALRPDQQNTFYIKRLVGLGGDTLRIEPDYELIQLPTKPPGVNQVLVGHPVVNGEHLSASTPRFENLYTFYGAKRGAEQLPYVENHYFGHAMLWNFAPGKPPFTVGTNSLFVMGDNTMNSSDSRDWGDFPKEKVIGKSSFVYWPLSERFGWSAHR